MNPIFLLFSAHLYCGSWEAKQMCVPKKMWDNIFQGYIFDFDGFLRYKPDYDSGIGEKDRIPATSDRLI